MLCVRVSLRAAAACAAVRVCMGTECDEGGTELGTELGTECGGGALKRALNAALDWALHGWQGG